MNAQPLSNTPEAEGSRCHAHPDLPVLGACARCGTFYCEQDRWVVNGKAYCEACSVRPEVDYLEGFRQKCWGKRDAWSWLVGFGAVFNALSGILILASGEPSTIPFGVFGLAAGAVGMCFWLGMPWARTALIGVPVGSMVLGALGEGGAAVGRGLVPLLITIAIYNDTRNKLFFKQEVLPEALKKAWHLYMNNTMARAGVMLGVLGLFVPGVGAVALICSIIGLRRVDPNGNPPIGRKGQAIAGIILGGLATLGWGGFFVSMLFKG
ncbi:DUF4190 domain-containing protein [Pyxidicoccus sp. 3LFB2]